jgi:hypothetical protein
MNVTTGWELLVNAFGEDCIVKTKFGARLSVAKIIAKGDVISKIESFGFQKGKHYKAHGRFGQYIRDEGAYYNVTDFFVAHSQCFTGVKGIIKTPK